jgi:plastocyanin domain-containing protein
MNIKILQAEKYFNGFSAIVIFKRNLSSSCLSSATLAQYGKWTSFSLSFNDTVKFSDDVDSGLIANGSLR